MADISDILGVETKVDDIEEVQKPKKPTKVDPYAYLPRYLREIVDENNPPPEMLFKEKKGITLSKEPAKKWVFDEFHSSARTDGKAFRHWVRKNVEYPDYPFSRFNVKIDVITYMDSEYDDCVFDLPNNWEKEQTDTLFSLCRDYDLRWPVIMDQFPWKQYSLEDCQTVFLDVTKTILERRNHLGAKLTENEECFIRYRFDMENSVKRRKQLHSSFLCQSAGQQEEKTLQEKIKKCNEMLSLLGPPDMKRYYGPRIHRNVLMSLIDSVSGKEKDVIQYQQGCHLASSYYKEEIETAKDMKEELKRILSELGVDSLRLRSLQGRQAFYTLKKSVVTCLLAKKYMADCGYTLLPKTAVKRWTSETRIPESKKKKSK